MAPPEPTVVADPCFPNPCGQFSQCRNIGNVPSCSCLAGYMGSPPNCRRECTINSECASNKACMREKCRDPCPGSCGVGALCVVMNHTPVCTCVEGYTGDPFTNCYPKPPEPQSKLLLTPKVFEDYIKRLLLGPPMHSDPCDPSPCGSNAQCSAGTCTCLFDYQGDPYVGCRPECVVSTDCSVNKACVRQKCQNPCPGTCGQNAECNVLNHIPMCSCPPGLTGNAFIQCRTMDRKTINF